MTWQDRERGQKNLQPVQQLLGEVSMAWATLDRWVDRILTDMLDISLSETAAIVSGMRLSAKCQIVRRLLAVDCPSPEWAEKMEALMLEIGVELNNERNRLVHDGWVFTADRVEQINATARIEKVPFRGKGLSFDKRRTVELEDLRRWNVRAFSALLDLRELRPALLPWLLERRAQLSQPPHN